MTRTLSIQEAARLTGLSEHTLRYYERIGLLSPVARAKNGHRRYQQHDLERMQFLTCLRNTGMPIKDIQAFIALEQRGDATSRDRCRLLAQHKQQVLEQINTLQENLRAIDNKIAYYQKQEAV